MSWKAGLWRFHASVLPVLGQMLYSAERGWAFLSRRTDWLLRRQFNRWARWDLGPQMERDHRHITEKALERMAFRGAECILDLGCGTGWASRLLRERAGSGAVVVGIDLAEEMLRRARAQNNDEGHLHFVQASAEKLPFQDSFFSKIVSVQTFYFFENPEQVLEELLRLTAPEGELALIICLHKDNPESLKWRKGLHMPVQVRNAKEYKTLLEEAGWSEVAAEMFEPEAGEKANPHERALFLMAKKKR